jgi:muramoyltetrapeptide carboxypeptidase
MKRRDFLIKSSLAGMACSSFNSLMMATSSEDLSVRLLKPPRLREGAVIGMIAPASPPAAEKFDKAFENLKNLGFKVKPGASLRARTGHLAGTDAQRLADLHQAFADPEVEAVWCIRGGYGCSRLLPSVDYDLIRRHPKPFIGYSDITALHLAIHGKTGLVTFHGPVVASDFPDNTLEHFRSVLMHPTARYDIAIPGAAEVLPGDEYKPWVVHPGKARGALIGGNLALLSALAGTPYMPAFNKKLVFIEDIGEQPYRIDRMLTQLLQASDLKKAAGIALGVFTDCAPKGDSASWTLAETLTDRLGNLGIPVLYGVPFGHVSHQATLPYGIQAELDTEKGMLSLLETAVI